MEAHSKIRTATIRVLKKVDADRGNVPIMV